MVTSILFIVRFPPVPFQAHAKSTFAVDGFGVVEGRPYTVRDVIADPQNTYPGSFLYRLDDYPADILFGSTNFFVLGDGQYWAKRVP